MTLTDLAQRKYGKGSIFKFGDNPLECEVISTSSIKLDDALGVGGIPRKRITEIFGPEGSGKTTLCCHIVAEAQKDGKAIFVDVEHSLDGQWAELCGVNLSELYISQPDTAEQALDIVEMSARSGEVFLIILDSVAALVPKAEVEGEMGDAHMALKARLMGQALRKIQPILQQHNVTLIFTNQLRDNIGSMFGPREVTTGGHALRYAASVRLDLRKKEQIKDKDKIIGNYIQISVRKNKVAPPFKVVKLAIWYNEGISKIDEIMNLAIENNLIEKSGAWFVYGDKRIQGVSNLHNYLKENDEILNDLEAKIREEINE